MAVRRVARQEVAVDDRHDQVAAFGVARVAAVPAGLERAGRRAAVAGDGVAVVASFGRQLQPVAARRRAAVRSRADRFGAAIGPAAVTAVRVPAVASFAAFLHTVAARRAVAGLAGPRARESRLDPAGVAAAVSGRGVPVVALLEPDLHSVAAARDAAGAGLRAGPPRLELAARVAAVSRLRVLVVAGF